MVRRARAVAILCATATTAFGFPAASQPTRSEIQAKARQAARKARKEAVTQAIETRRALREARQEVREQAREQRQEARERRREAREQRQEVREEHKKAGEQRREAREERRRAFRERLTKWRESREERRQKRRSELRKRWGEKVSDPAAMRAALREHGWRMARLQRIRLLAQQNERTELVARVDKLMEKERRLHERRMQRLGDPSKAPKPLEPSGGAPPKSALGRRTPPPTPKGGQAKPGDEPAGGTP